MAFKRFRKVKYKVTGAFGDSDEGEIRDALVVIEDSEGGSALLYHPKDEKGSCSSLEMAHQESEGIYVSSAGDPDAFGYVNIEAQADLNAFVRNAKRLNLRGHE